MCRTWSQVLQLYQVWTKQISMIPRRLFWNIKSNLIWNCRKNKISKRWGTKISPKNQMEKEIYLLLKKLKKERHIPSVISQRWGDCKVLMKLMKALNTKNKSTMTRIKWCSTINLQWKASQLRDTKHSLSLMMTHPQRTLSQQISNWQPDLMARNKTLTTWMLIIPTTQRLWDLKRRSTTTSMRMKKRLRGRSKCD